MTQPPNTPLNADELDNLLGPCLAFILGPDDEKCLHCERVEAVLADRKKHELQARKDQTFKVIQSLVKSGSISDSSAAHTLALHNTLLDDQSQQELEKL